MSSVKITRPTSKQPIPDHAERVFAGVLFDVYQWQQQMYDSTTQTFEKLKRPDTVIVFAVLDDGRIVLTRQEQPGKKPFIGAAGGRVDDGEDILEAAKRELLEETGYKADDWTLWHSEQPISKIEWAVYVFVAKKYTKLPSHILTPAKRSYFYPSHSTNYSTSARHQNFRQDFTKKRLSRSYIKQSYTQKNTQS